jgi:hypothetical protein
VSDINLLTIVVGCLGLLLMDRIPENVEAIEKMGFLHLTLDILVKCMLLAGVLFPIWHILGWFGL